MDTADKVEAAPAVQPKKDAPAAAARDEEGVAPAPAAAAAPAAAPTGIVGRPTINMCMSVPAEKEAEMDELFKGHETWMRSQHKMGADGDDSEMIRLLEFYISKGKEPVDPMDPSKGETGNLLYIMSEVYAAPEGIGKHMEEGGKNWPGMASFPAAAMEFGKLVQIGACTVLTCLADEATPFTTSYGEPGIHMAMAVPPEKEAEVDELWKGHEEFMRANHTMGTDGDDSETVRLTSFYITKGKQPVDPMDPSKGETGNIIYNMSETYAAAEGIGKHMELGGEKWPGMPKLVELMGEHGLFMEVGATTVMTNLTDAAAPAAAALFFDGTPVAGKAAQLADLYADEFTISFVGPYTGPTTGMVMDKAKAMGAMGNLAASFPDLTFNAGNEPPMKLENGGWGAKILVKGTHTGAAFTPMPGMLPAIETTNKECSIGPELFTMFCNAEGKATALTIEPLHEGALVGPPGFYVLVGGTLPPPAPTAAPTGIVGRPTINMCMSVPAEKEAEMDELFKGHETWMRSQHKMGADGDDSEMIRLLEFYISKGKEPVDPMDPSKGETGNLLYIMSEVYAAPEGIGKHMEEGGKNWPGMASFPAAAMEFGKLVQIGACTVLTCLADEATPFTTSYGEPGIHMAMAVPPEKEAEVDELWKGHEEFMRANHTMGTDGDDSETVRLTSFYITKGKQPVDPMDPSKGETGNIIYNMSETYAAAEGIGKHMELGGEKWPGMPKLVELMGEHGLFMEVGATTVMTNLTDV